MTRTGDPLESLADLLQLPEPSHTVFEHPPLVLAICQVRFTRVLGVEDPKFVAPFQRAVQSVYPILSEQRQVRVHFTRGPSEGNIEEEQPTSRWQFADGEENWTLVLAQDFVALETRAYEEFSDFVARLRFILDALVAHVQPARWTRLGLRYIDEVRPADGECLNAMMPEILGPLASEGLRQNAEEMQAVQQIALRFTGGQGITIHHGLLPDGSTVQPRYGSPPASGPFYFLDVDAFQEATARGGELIDPAQICERVKLLNRACYKLFRWAITEEYAATLGERPRAG